MSDTVVTTILALSVLSYRPVNAIIGERSGLGEERRTPNREDLGSNPADVSCSRCP